MSTDQNGLAARRHQPSQSIIGRYVGGASGSKAAHPTDRDYRDRSHELGRPVKLCHPREQGFTIATFRAETRQQCSSQQPATANFRRSITKAQGDVAIDPCSSRH